MKQYFEHLLLLSQENIGLSIYEASSLLELKKYELKKSLLLTKIDKNNIKKINRLANTKKIFRLLLQTDTSSLEKSLEIYDWSKIYKTNFCIRIHMMEPIKKVFEERECAKFIWRSLVKNNIKPKVNLDNPKTLIEIFVLKKISYICLLLYENIEHFENRKAHMKPALHPTAMHPKLARTLINILNPGDKEIIIDPFCGACGILTEAGLMKIRFKGFDIDKAMINRAFINLGHYHIKNIDIKQKDATKQKNLKYVVTDLPYGKSSKKSDEIIKLYSEFIKNISGRSVIVFPDFVDYKKILRMNLNKKFSVKKVLSHYVHKTLTRKIVVIDKKI